MNSFGKIALASAFSFALGSQMLPSNDVHVLGQQFHRLVQVAPKMMDRFITIQEEWDAQHAERMKEWEWNHQKALQIQEENEAVFNSLRDEYASMSRQVDAENARIDQVRSRTGGF